MKLRTTRRVMFAIALAIGAVPMIAVPKPAQAAELPSIGVIDYFYSSGVSFVETSDLNWLTGLAHAVNGHGCCENTAYDYSSTVDRYRYLNWTNDGCSIMADRTGYYDFTKPCIRHDFSYRNWKDVEDFRRFFGLADADAWNETKRQVVDDTFLQEMYATCEGRWFFVRGACYREAEIWHAAIRWLGGMS